MPPLPKKRTSLPGENLETKLSKLNIHTMKKKSARIGMRLSNAFGLSAHTIDEEFNLQEQRFRSMDKFLKVFQRNITHCVQTIRVILT